MGGNAVVVWVLCVFQGDRVSWCQDDTVRRQPMSSMNEGMQTEKQQSRQFEIIGKHKAKQRNGHLD